MKSLKKTFALLVLVTLGFGCASVTDDRTQRSA